MEIKTAIQTGDTQALATLLSADEGLIASRIEGRTLLHLATDWPGHFPNVAATIQMLIAAGADVNARVEAKFPETPLHWAASSNDVAALDALLDGGADIEAQGAVLGGGSPLSDAIGFGCWECARRLAERGAKIAELWHAAGLGRLDLMEELAVDADARQLAGALWIACSGGQREAAEFLLHRGADINWIGWDKKTPLDAANPLLQDWLRQRGAKSAREMHP